MAKEKPVHLQHIPGFYTFWPSEVTQVREYTHKEDNAGVTFAFDACWVTYRNSSREGATLRVLGTLESVLTQLFGEQRAWEIVNESKPLRTFVVKE